MEFSDERSSDGKVWGLFKLPFRNQHSTKTSSSSGFTHYNQQQQSYNNHNNIDDNSQVEGPRAHGSSSVSSVARSLLPTRRRLKLDPASKLYFPCNNSVFCISFYEI
ncbi:unnamed protein product [Fraxinus pennsylvanica]|uniref:Uncharacterized protein n=1 Tax=Fraxinus pennsylvanica TaxID=56036 RepID=A0AAD1YZD3_9LAMI|nr:unnamed protein product [Fraxinus pennsylvanica]